MIELPIYNKILVFLIDLIGIWLAILVYRDNSKRILNKIFVFIVILMFLWVNFAYFARVIGPDLIYLSLLFLKIAWFVTPLFFTFLYILAIYLLKKEKQYQLLTKFVLFFGIGITLITGFTNLIIKEIKFIDGNLVIIYGMGMLLFLGVISFLIYATLYPLFKGYFKFSKKEKQKIQYFLLGISIFYLANIIFNIILPLVFGVVHFYWLGDYSAIFLLGFTGYAIVKQKLFGMKVVSTSLFVGLIAILILLDTLFFTPDFNLQLFKAVILILFIYFGYLLIKGVKKEIEQREKLEKTAKTLTETSNKLQKSYKKLEKLDKAKSEFISIASHQLRTPLTATKGYTSMILEGTYGKLSGKIRKPMESVYKANERLIKLVNELLSISRIESGKMELKLEKASLNEIIKSVIDELKVRTREKNIYLRFEEPLKNSPEYASAENILVDKDKIRHIVSNLIDNAIHYTEKGGIKVKIMKKREKIRIIISDTGDGMDKEELSKVFNSFSRGKAGSRLYTEGAGLGLYIARRFVKMHKGSIWAKSRGKGKGTVFYIELPVK